MKPLGPLILTLALASPLAAQAPTDSTLALALRLVTEGQGDSARAIVRGRLARLSPFDSLYPEALYVSGAVAGNVDTALAAFRRLGIEYSQSRWAARGLLRVAQLRFAQGDHVTAGRTAERVLEDYPFSDARAEAAYWAARVQLEQDDMPAACSFLSVTVTEAGENIELANRARFYLQRCGGTVLEDSAPRDTAAAPPPAPPVRDSTFAVQVAAVGTAAAADEAMRSLRTAGFTARVFRDDDGLFKVRVGQFRTRREAQQLLTQIRSRVGGSPFVVGEQ